MENVNNDTPEVLMSPLLSNKFSNLEDKINNERLDLINKVNNPQLFSLAENCVRNRTVIDLFILDK